MKPFDVALLIVVVVFAFRGFLRGFFRESFGFLALILGILSALQLATPVAGALGRWIDLPEATRAIVAFVATFLAVHTAVNLSGFLFERLLGSLLFRSVSRVAGAAFGAGKAAILAAFVLLFLSLFPVVPAIEDRIAESKLARPLIDVAGTVLRDQWRSPAGPEEPEHA